MKNKIYRPGNDLSLPVPSGTKSGEPVKVGGFVGVASTNRGEGGNIATHASVDISGDVFELPVDGAIASVGTAIYITSARALSVSASGNDLFGYSACLADGSLATKSTGVGPAAVKPLKV
jgi:predicted RecA/RadA family phage recombinase